MHTPKRKAGKQKRDQAIKQRAYILFAPIQIQLIGSICILVVLIFLRNWQRNQSILITPVESVL